MRSHTKFGPDGFSRFDVFWIQTNKQKQTSNVYIYTSLLGRFAPIFYFYCEHVHFVYIVKEKQTKHFADFIRKIVDFFVIFKKRIFYFLPDRFSRFEVYWIQTNRHNQAKYQGRK